MALLLCLSPSLYGHIFNWLAIKFIKRPDFRSKSWIHANPAWMLIQRLSTFKAAQSGSGNWKITFKFQHSGRDDDNLANCCCFGFFNECCVTVPFRTTTIWNQTTSWFCLYSPVNLIPLLQCCFVSTVSWFGLVVPKQWWRLPLAKPQFTEIFVLWPVMNKLYDETHKNVLKGYFVVLTSTLNMLEQL